ncbi:MAG: hypothetical protein HZB26_11255 [Candidatus Hydrogenedentes bacterium]|nr:hypothetical protein [Candidatus Hydrogenedentota bacterium]
MAARTARAQEKKVNPDLVAKALAKSVLDGDIVNFRLLLRPFSPARVDTTERFETEKYAYLLPDPEMEGRADFQRCLDSVRRPETWAHIQRELAANRPAQLPSDLLIALGDNAVRAGKYTSAAQAYELLRIRRRMQEEYFRQAEQALDDGDVPKAVLGYRIATGLGYNYAAFPEPLPVVPEFQTRALMLHGDYPEDPAATIGMQAPDVFMRTALGYLLLDAEASARLEERPLAIRLEFLKELVRQQDPEWTAFTARYRETVALMQQFGEQMLSAGGRNGKTGTLADEIEAQRRDDPRRIPEHLLGRAIENGEWWQYLKDLAYCHPAAALFVARQAIGDLEILVPRCAADSPAARALGLVDG